MVSKKEINAARTRKGGWTRAQLKVWGIGWPPPRGWKTRLLKGNILKARKEMITGNNPAPSAYMKVTEDR